MTPVFMDLQIYALYPNGLLIYIIWYLSLFVAKNVTDMGPLLFSIVVVRGITDNAESIIGTNQFKPVYPFSENG